VRSKGIAAWLALLLGSVGAHRFYLYGLADRWALAHIPPTLLALLALRGVKNVDSPELTWALPLFGLMVAIGCLSAILIGLTPDERWNARHNPDAPQESRWAPILATIAALLVGGVALMGTIAYTAQRYFEISLGQ
jgi:TM2 domain